MSVAAAVSLSWVLCVAVALPALGQSAAAEPETIPELEAAFEVGEIRSDFVVVIDTSSSMAGGPDPLYPKVEDAFAGLVDAIPDGDFLGVITFDSVSTTGPTGPLDDAARVAAKDLPAADGQATDIGRALNAAVERLDRPDASSIQTVIFITDGAHEPPAGSPFAEVGGPAWQEARARAEQLEDRRTIQVRALGLGDAGKQGAELVDQVFANPEVVELSGQQLQDYLTTEVRNARRQVLVDAVQTEIDRGEIEARVETSGELDDEIRATVDLTSNLEHLGVDIDLEQVSATDFNGNAIRTSIVDGSRTIHLPPGESTSFDVLIRPDVEAGPLFSLPPPAREEIDVALDFQQVANATPTALLADDLGVSTEVTVAAVDPFTVGRTTGKTWGRLFFEIAVALALLALAIWVYVRFVRKPRLEGELVLAGAAQDSLPPIKLKGKSMSVESADFNRPGNTRIRLYTRRGKRSQVFASLVGLDGSFERQVGPRWKQFEAGGSLGLTVYRIDGPAGTNFRYRLGEERT